MSKAAQRPQTELDFREFPDADTLHAALADEIVRRLGEGVTRHDRASLVVPGGATPAPFFDALATHDAPWRNVHITLSDDRWREGADLPLNETLVRARLLQNHATQANFIPLRNGAAQARDAQNDINAAIAAMPRPFDVVLLGMGTDGHSASLLPFAPDLNRALDRRDPALVRALYPAAPSADDERMTLTLRALLDARWIALLLRGEAKRDAYRRVMSGTEATEAPARAVLQQSATPVCVFWSP